MVFPQLTYSACRQPVIAMPNMTKYELTGLASCAVRLGEAMMMGEITASFLSRAGEYFWMHRRYVTTVCRHVTWQRRQQSLPPLLKCHGYWREAGDTGRRHLQGTAPLVNLTVPLTSLWSLKREISLGMRSSETTAARGDEANGRAYIARYLTVRYRPAVRDTL